MDNYDDTTFLDITELRDESHQTYDGAQRFEDYDFDDTTEPGDGLVTRFRLNEGSY